MYRQWMFLAGTVIIPFLLFGNIPILSPSTEWVELPFPGTVSDYYGDSTSSNKPNSEIIGSSGHPALYTRFDDGGDSLATSGELAFRMRFSGNSGKSPFQSFIWIGLDITLDGSPDLFLGADRTSLGIYDAGDTLNFSPATTTFNSTAFWSTPSSSANFNFSPVSSALEPTATSFNLDASGGTDHFVTFVIPFEEIVNAVTSLTPVVGFNDTSTLSYLAGVSDTSSNRIDADIIGINGGLNSELSWKVLMALGPEVGVDGTVVPEPAQAAALMGMGAFLLLVLFRRRDR